jgi:hypothetical protein
MKARVKATGEIIDETAMVSTLGDDFYLRELEPISEDMEVIDYWTRLEHTYAGMAMQGVVNSFNNRYRDSCALRYCITGEDSEKLLKESAKVAADVCYYFAHALVEKMKNQSV